MTHAPGFDTQILRVTHPDDVTETVHVLQPGERATVPWDPVHLIPAWNPGGRPTPVGRNVALREDLESSLLAAGGRFALGAAHAPDLSWAEEVLAVSGLDDDEAAGIAEAHEQQWLMRTDGRTLVVLRAGSAEQVAAIGVRTEPLTHRPCVRPRHQPDPAAPCVRPGGGHTGRSIEVAAYFERDRDALLAVLGCDTCADGRRIRAIGGPILLHEWSAASRYRPPEIIRPLTLDELG